MAHMHYLFLPSVRPGNGTGHLRRSLRLAAKMNHEAKVSVYIPASEWRDEFSQFLIQEGLPESIVVDNEEELGRRNWDFTIWDRRETREDEFREWRSFGIPVGIDEGGAVRKQFPLLIDTFPLPASMGKPNIGDPAFLPHPEHRREPPERFDKVIISFGGEDPAHLTEKMTAWLLRKGGYPAESLSVVLGPLFGERVLPAGVHLLEAPENLSERLADYDLVCTSFGLTAYEAAAAGTGVILFNPSAYHKSLSELAGFSEVGVHKIDSRKMENCLRNPLPHIPLLKKIIPSEPRSLSELLLSLSPPQVDTCPACGFLGTVSVFREDARTFSRCSACGTMVQHDFSPREPAYNEEYFFAEYRQQYGRTYLEDFDSIRGLARRRIKVIESMGVPEQALFLDVGCAYGPFLREAAESGYRVEGLDVAESAVTYVRETLGYEAHCGSFEEYSDGEGRFDIITMWFVIEHFSGTGEVLQKVYRLLKPGGILAFSTPNLTGISGRKDLRAFLHGSPRDHHIVWSPKIAQKVLADYGFTTERSIITGHHPERFLSPKRKVPAAVQTLFSLISRAAGLGDTFEIYARKNGGAHG